MNIMVILNDAPYGLERTFQGLRMADAMLKLEDDLELTLYLSNQRLEDTRGEQNLRRMQVDIADVFNRGLFPNGRPKIKQVLFKELSIQ